MILITGATGNNGTEIIKGLAGSGARVRAMVRKYPDAIHPGVEYVMADFDDHVSIRRALDGVHRAFLTTNSTERVEAQQLNFVEQARAAGVRHIVYLSQLHAARSSPMRFLRYHAVVEEAIAHPGWRSRIYVRICTCKASSDFARRLRRRDAFLRRQ